MQAYMNRTGCYKHVTNMIRQLMSTSEAAEQVENLNSQILISQILISQILISQILISRFFLF